MELEGSYNAKENFVGASPRKMVLILGHGRSGTTLLNKVLSAHPQIGFISDEYNYLHWFWKNQFLYERYGSEKYWRMAKDLHLDPNLVINTPIVKEDYIDIKSFEAWVLKLIDLHCAEKAIGGIKIADFLKDNCEMIANECKSAYCLHIVRDPRDVYLSIQNIPIGNRSPFYCGKSWGDSVSRIKSLKERIEHYHEVRYEDLVAKPGETILEICNWLGIEYSDRMMRFYEFVEGDILPMHKLLCHDFVPNNYNKWQGVLSKKELAYLHAGCGDRIFDCGYEVGSEIYRISFPARIKEYCLSKLLLYRDLIKNGRLSSHNNRRLKLKLYIRNILSKRSFYH